METHSVLFVFLTGVKLRQNESFVTFTVLLWTLVVFKVRWTCFFSSPVNQCYTKQGLELTRVTVIDSEMKVIYDTFVKPESKVVDYNTRWVCLLQPDAVSVMSAYECDYSDCQLYPGLTWVFVTAVYVSHRFSGVTEEDLESATISLRDVQAVLLSMFSAESILIGHSLESDLLALKVLWLFIRLQDFLFNAFEWLANCSHSDSFSRSTVTAPLCCPWLTALVTYKEISPY